MSWVQADRVAGTAAVSQAQLPCRSARVVPCRTPARICLLPRPAPASPRAPSPCFRALRSCACLHAHPRAQRSVQRRVVAQCRALASRVLGWLCCIATQPSLSSLSLSQYKFLYCDTNFPAALLLQYNPTIHFPITSLLLQYNKLYCNTVLQQPSCSSHNTNVVLQYKFTAFSPIACNTISILQYNFFFLHNIIGQ